MRKIKFYNRFLVKILFVSIPLTIVTSCKKDFLEAIPETTISEATAFDTPERVLTQVNGLYSTLRSQYVDVDGNILGFLSGRYQIFSDIRAEEFKNQSTNVVTGYDIYQHTNGADNRYLSNMWTAGYLAINRVNTFLAGLQAKPDAVSAQLSLQYASEAKFIRALTYFSLVQFFAQPYTKNNGASPGLPLRLQAESTSANNSLKRSTVAEVYSQILKDLNEAEAGLAANNGSDLASTIRAHKNAAIALKTRVYLVMGNYAQVIAEGNKIVPNTAPFVSSSNIPHSLQPNVSDVFQAPFTTKESIFSLAMAESNAPGTQNELGNYFNYEGGASFEYSLNDAAPGIYANPQWEADDKRKTDLTGISDDGDAYLAKYSGESPFTDYVPIIRYAEVLLNVAEAEARVGTAGGLIRARALLDAVHKRSDPTYDFGVLTQAQLISAILTERRIELLGEGFRSNDLLRLTQAIPSVGAGASISSTDEKYIFPIPVIEVQANPGL
jgi:hypothetical protein